MDIECSLYTPHAGGALTFADCGKSKQKHAFGDTRRSAVAVKFSACDFVMGLKCVAFLNFVV